MLILRPLPSASLRLFSFLFCHLFQLFSFSLLLFEYCRIFTITVFLNLQFFAHKSYPLHLAPFLSSILFCFFSLCKFSSFNLVEYTFWHANKVGLLIFRPFLSFYVFFLLSFILLFDFPVYYSSVLFESFGSLMQ